MRRDVIPAELAALAPAAPIALALGVMLHLAKLAAKSCAWHGVLRTALPAHDLTRRDALAAYLPSVGLNALLPGRIGLPARVALFKARAPAAPCATVAATMAAESAASLVPLALLLTIAVLVVPATSPLTLVAPAILAMPAVVVAAVALAVIVMALVATRRGGATMRIAGVAASQAGRGFAIFARRPAALIRVVGWETAAWTARIGSLICFLAAYGIRPTPAVVAAVLLAQAAASLAVVMPLGAGAQQLALVAMLGGVASPADALAFGIGMQLAVAGAGIAAGIAALALAGGDREVRRLVAGAVRSVPAALTRPGPQRKGAESIVAWESSPSGQPAPPGAAQPALNVEGIT